MCQTPRLAVFGSCAEFCFPCSLSPQLSEEGEEKCWSVCETGGDPMTAWQQKTSVFAVILTSMVCSLRYTCTMLVRRSECGLRLAPLLISLRIHLKCASANKGTGYYCDRNYRRALGMRPHEWRRGTVATMFLCSREVSRVCFEFSHLPFLTCEAESGEGHRFNSFQVDLVTVVCYQVVDFLIDHRGAQRVLHANRGCIEWQTIAVC